MKKLFLLLVLMAGLATTTQAQRIKWKLHYIGAGNEAGNGASGYVGTMDPKWFSVVHMTLPSNNPAQLAGAQGTMQGERFGTMAFSLETNQLPTADSLMVRTNNGWYPVEKVKQKGDKLTLQFDWAYRPKPQGVDLAILKRATLLLTDSTHWNTTDDRQCEDDLSNGQYSLYCALKAASLDVTGDFNHRNAALNIVRQQIGLMRPGREYAHRLMDFNNEEPFAVIKALLTQSIAVLETELGH